MRLYNALTLLAAVALAPGSANAQWDDFSRWHVMPMQIDRENRSDSFLGVLLEDVDPNRVEELNLPAERGALVARVIEESPAAGAGIEADDVITRWNDATVEGARALQRLVGETPVGRAVDVSLIRGGEQKQVEVLVGTRDDFGGQRTAWHPPVHGTSWVGRYHICRQHLSEPICPGHAPRPDPEPRWRPQYTRIRVH